MKYVYIYYIHISISMYIYIYIMGYVISNHTAIRSNLICIQKTLIFLFKVINKMAKSHL